MNASSTYNQDPGWWFLINSDTRGFLQRPKTNRVMCIGPWPSWCSQHEPLSGRFYKKTHVTGLLSTLMCPRSHAVYLRGPS